MQRAHVGAHRPPGPAETRWETLWIYAQGGPGVFRATCTSTGSRAIFATASTASTPGACPLYLLTGEYDFSCTPEDTRPPRPIPGARFTIMKELGHFPMGEHPAAFRRYLLPVLDEIRAAAR